MRDLDRALTDIHAIREYLARGTEFRGYGPATLALTGVLALLVAAVQNLWFKSLRGQDFVLIWVATAVLSVIIIGAETVQRSRRAHGSLAACMLQAAVEQFLPAIVAGGLLTVVMLQVLPADAWMLPGLWQLVFSLGVFASLRFLPRSVFIVGVWYLACGLANLTLGSQGHLWSAWSMGVPFGIGQLMVADILKDVGLTDDRHERRV